MSLGPQWCSGVLFGLLLPWQAPRARPGAFGTDLGSPVRRGPAATGSGGGKTSGDAKHPSHVGFVADPSVLQDAKQHFGRALRRQISSHTWWNSFLGAEGHTSHLRSVTPRFAAKRFLLPEHCAALVTALQEYSVHDAHIHAATRRCATSEQSCCKASAPA